MLPAFDPRPWGGLDLSPVYPNHKFSEKIGEVWFTGDHCKIANGPLTGVTLEEASIRYGRDLVGQAPREPARFPLLLKFIFPHEKLSLQVHPDDVAAQRAGLPGGKTECWYVADAKPGAQVALGLKAGVTRGELERAIHERRAEELLNWVNIYPGEMIYVAGGTVHTIGPGAVLVETQQQSDTTYRLYDYGRPRELHLKEGLAVVKERVASGKVIRPAPFTLNGHKNRHSPLIAAPYFVVDRFELSVPHTFGAADKSEKNSVQIMVAVEGCGVVDAPGMEPVALTKGNAVAVPACVGEFTVCPQWSVEFLKSYVPGEALPEPATSI